MNMSEEETYNDFDHLVSRYLSGELGPAEIAAFHEELDRDPAKRELLDEYQKIWDSAGAAPGGDPYDLDREWLMMKEKLPAFGKVKVRLLIDYSRRIAALLLFGLLLTFSWIYVGRNSGLEKVVAENEPVELGLDDGTRVILNRHSRLRYSKTFEEGERKIFLSGEAWFDVSPDTARPFIVDAGAALVKVLGTSFNVNAYKKNPVVEITVESGLVGLSAKQDAGDLIVMKAGSGGTYHKAARELMLIPDSDPNTISWKTRELFFEESTLQEVAGLVSRVYGVEVVIVNRELASCPITVTFRNQTLEAILKVLELTLDLQVSREGNEIRLAGEGCVE
ncbi:MAG: FecR domain-containing protein [Bacteroidales bacterium]|nr:FecR domain-containing protein [Bacteroidales bacterium]